VGVLLLAVVGQDQRTRSERHDLPGREKSERIAGEDDQIHAGKKDGIERQNAPRRRLFAPVTDGVEACGARA
jgi:hypothetical protein